MSPSPDVAQQLARKGRVRRDVRGLGVAEVARRMNGRDAAGLLHDGAGWDAARIAGELSTSARQVRLDVARARLAAVDADCEPCSRHLDGLMTFAAEAIDHSMTCAECKATRQSLRQGKQALRDRWQDEPEASRPATGARPSRSTTVVRPAALRHHVPDPTPLTSHALPRSTPAERDRHSHHARVPERHRPVEPAPRRSPPPGGDRRPLSLPDRSPGRTRLATGVNSAAPPLRATAAPVPRRPAGRGRIRQGAVVVLAMSATALAGIPPLLRLVVGLGAVVSVVIALTWSQPVLPRETAAPQSSVTAAGPAATPVAVTPPPAIAVVIPAATQTPAPTPTPTPTATPTPVPTAAPVPTPTPVPSGPSLETWEALARCESSSNWAADTGNGFYGGLQFTLDSWRLVGGTGYPYQHSKDDQIARARDLLEIQGWRAWPVCSRKLGLR